jgi:hypothetical protein
MSDLAQIDALMGDSSTMTITLPRACDRHGRFFVETATICQYRQGKCEFYSPGMPSQATLAVAR